MAAPQPKERTLVLSDNIDKSTVKDIMQNILIINDDDYNKELDYKDWKREPIKLFINSFGGSVYDGLALIDVIKYSVTPVHTICVGSGMSMGLWIWMSGHQRIIGKHATLMFHDLSTWAIGKTPEIKQELAEVLRLQDMLIDEITKTSLITKKQIMSYVDRKAEWYISAQEAIKYKLADKFLGE